MDPSLEGRRWLPDEPGNLGLDKVLKEVSKDDQEEWEYEYSTTETETYYLTVELSYDGFKEAQGKVHHHSRGGYYKNWMDVTAATAGAALDNENDDDDDPLPQPEGDDEIPLDPAVGGTEQSMATSTQNHPDKDKGKGKGKGKGKDKDDGGVSFEKLELPVEDIQILDLHSANPIISYKNKVFQGEWAEVIGTEAIMLNCDDEDPNHEPLPALRNLPGGVDLLAASASRILTTEKILKPKIPKEDTLAGIRKEWNIRIPRGKDKSDERAEQARFLENLIALKKKKGHTDNVTVYAIPRSQDENSNDKKSADDKSRDRRDQVPDSEGGEASNSVRAKKRIGRPPKRRDTGGLSRRPSGRGTARAGERLFSMDMSPLSTPTPIRWNDLEQGDDGEESDIEVVDDVDGDEDVDMADNRG